MGELIFGYMVHHAYWESAAAVAQDMLAGTVHVQPKDIQEVCLQSVLLIQFHRMSSLIPLCRSLHECSSGGSGKGIELL